MKLIFNAFSIYCLAIRAGLYSKIFDGRVMRRLRNHEELTDKITVYLSNVCWRSRLKLKMAEAEFECKRLEFLNSSVRE